VHMQLLMLMPMLRITQNFCAVLGAEAGAGS